jgi:D-threo-aldose 1-dehydrogenase
MTDATDSGTIPSTRLGNSSIRISRIGFGGAGLGNLFTPVTDREAKRTLDRAWEGGIRYVDTAPHYGLGLSERRIGEALRERPRAEYVVSTKVGRILEPIGDHAALDTEGFAVTAAHRRLWDFTANGVRRSIHESLERLGLDRIDMVYLHDPDNHADEAFGAAYPELERLRAQGVVGAIGSAMNETSMLTRFVRETDVDAVLLAGRYTLLDQRGLADLLPEAARRGVSVVIGGVFNSGQRADPRPDATFDYTTAPPPLVERALRIKAICERHAVPLRAAALAFPFGHPAVASVLVGPKSVTELEDTARMLQIPIPHPLWDDLKAHGLLAPGIPVPVRTPSSAWPYTKPDGSSKA